MKRVLSGVLAALCLTSGVAFASEKKEESIPSFNEPSREHEKQEAERAETPLRRAMKAVSLSAGGGVEGFTGGLSDNIQVGPTWGAAVSVKPGKLLGAELAYTGATHEFNLGTNESGGAGSGADLVRNGGHVAGSIALAPFAVQPYVLAGVGVNRFNVRNSIPGFASSTSGYVPLAGGLRYEKNMLMVDARFAVNVQFNDDLGINPTTGQDINGTYYNGTVRLGARF